MMDKMAKSPFSIIKRFMFRNRAYIDAGKLFDAYLNLLTLRIDEQSELLKVPDPIECIVFSKNRSIQLHSLLNSYFDLVTDSPPINVLYDFSTNEHGKAYDTLIDIFQDKPISFTRQKYFRDDLIDIMEIITSPRIFFLADDIIFTRQLSLNGFCLFPVDSFVPSLRLGKNIEFGRTGRQRQSVPRFSSNRLGNDKQYNIWKWAEGDCDWGYPLSIDGNIFSTSELRCLIKHLTFTTPNTLETALQQFNGLFSHRFGVCNNQSSLVNVPCNRVQTDYRNIAGTVDTDFLLDKWKQGFAIDHRMLVGLRNNCPHQIVELRFVQRDEVS